MNKQLAELQNDLVVDAAAKTAAIAEKDKEIEKLTTENASAGEIKVVKQEKAALEQAIGTIANTVQEQQAAYDHATPPNTSGTATTGGRSVKSKTSGTATPGRRSATTSGSSSGNTADGSSDISVDIPPTPRSLKGRKNATGPATKPRSRPASVNTSPDPLGETIASPGQIAKTKKDAIELTEEIKTLNELIPTSPTAKKYGQNLYKLVHDTDSKKRRFPRTSQFDFEDITGIVDSIDRTNLLNEFNKSKQDLWHGKNIRLEVLVGNESGKKFWRAVGFEDYAITFELQNA